MIGALEHDFVNKRQVDDTTILEFRVDYTRSNGSYVTVPCTSILHRDGELVDSLRVYIDVAPVFEQAS
jgi:hypothetical protein